MEPGDCAKPAPCADGSASRHIAVERYGPFLGLARRQAREYSQHKGQDGQHLHGSALHICVDAKEIRFGAEGSRPAGKKILDKKSGAKMGIFARLRGGAEGDGNASDCLLPATTQISTSRFKCSWSACYRQPARTWRVASYDRTRWQRMYFAHSRTAACRASASGSGSGGNTRPEKKRLEFSMRPVGGPLGTLRGKKR